MEKHQYQGGGTYGHFDGTHMLSPPICGLANMKYIRAATDEGLAPKSSKMVCLAELGHGPDSSNAGKFSPVFLGVF